VLETCLLRPFQAAVGESSVDRPGKRDAYASYLSIPGPRSTVARDPPPEVYRAVRDARKTLVVLKRTRKGKGLTLSDE